MLSTARSQGFGLVSAHHGVSCPHRLYAAPQQPDRLLNSRNSRLQAPAVQHSKVTGRRPLHPACSIAVPENWGDFDALTQQLEELAEEVQELLQGASLYLVGMMGSGKSKTGRVLSSFLQYPFLDTDEMIEEVAGQKIAEIFEQEGEEAFREMETQILQEVMPIKSCIVSTGGGIVERNDNWSMMSHAIIIWLHGDTPLLARRVVADGRASRPLLKDDPQEGEQVQQEYERTVTRLEQILKRRKDKYALADLQVPIDGSQPSEQLEGAPVMGIVLRILQALEKRLKDDAAQRRLAQQFEVRAVTDLPNCNIIEARTNGKAS